MKVFFQGDSEKPKLDPAYLNLDLNGMMQWLWKYVFRNGKL